MTPPIYLDHHATTPCDPRVVEAMLPYFTESFGNPSSTIHSLGRKAQAAVEEAREQVAALINAHPKEILFTSGATESNNLAILGLGRGYSGSKRRIVTTAIEHKAVLAPLQVLAQAGFEVVSLPVTHEGRVNWQQLEAAITDDTLLVSVQAANNEIGTLQPLAEIGALARTHGAFFHTDAAQAVGKIPVDVEQWDVDLLSLSAHKLYGPKGVGALYVRGGAQAAPLTPLVLGGGQEAGLRSGTYNVPGIVGLGVACSLCQASLEQEQLRLAALRDRFEGLLMAGIEGFSRNGDLTQRLPYNSSFTIPGVDSETLLVNLPDLLLSTGSACNSGAIEPSPVLLALGMTRQDAYCSLRVGLGRWTTETEIEQAATQIGEAVRRIRALTSAPPALSAS